MYCKNCGNQMEDTAKFCSVCGADNSVVAEENLGEPVLTANKPTENKVWGVFARIGWGIGLGTLIACIFIGIGGFVAPYGIVFSALGKKSSIYADKARSGLIMSIIATVVGISFFFIFIFVMAAVGTFVAM